MMFYIKSNLKNKFKILKKNLKKKVYAAAAFFFLVINIAAMPTSATTPTTKMIAMTPGFSMVINNEKVGS